MITINIQELPPTTVDAIKSALAEGEDIFITNNEEEHLAKVVSVQKEDKSLSDKPIRQGGFARNKIHLLDDWDSSEVNDEIAREFGMLD